VLKIVNGKCVDATILDIKSRHFSQEICFLKMKPLQVLRSPKNVGAFKVEGTNPFMTVPFTINNAPIRVDIEGLLANEDMFVFDQYGKLKLCLDVSGNGEIQHLSNNLMQTLKQLMEQETLPEFKLVVKSFVFNERVYIIWPTERKKFLPVDVIIDGKVETIYPDDAKGSTKKFEEFCQEYKGYAGSLVADAELYCWARRDDEKHELVVGITPRLKVMTIEKAKK